MPKFRTHYDNLKVSRDAPIEVIQAAYRSLARKYHPDANGSTKEGEAVMKVINASYEVLSDPVKRAKHDEWIAAQLRADRGGFSPTERGERSSGGSGSRGTETEAEKAQRAVVTLIVSVVYFSVSFWMLRFPSMRIVGVLLILAGWVYFAARRR